MIVSSVSGYEVHTSRRGYAFFYIFCMRITRNVRLVCVVGDDRLTEEETDGTPRFLSAYR